MSSKFVFGFLLPAVLVMVLAFILRGTFTRTPQRTAPVVAAPAPAPAPVPQQAVNINPPVPRLQTVAAPAPPPMTEEQREEAIDDEKDRLMELESSQDPQALSEILADLSSPEKEIRMAAIDAAEQVHDTNAIPVLKADAVTNDDTDEQMALLQAAKFIATPEGDLVGPELTPDQIRAAQQQRAQEKAQRQAQTAGQGQSPNQAGQAGQSPPQGPPQ